MAIQKKSLVIATEDNTEVYINGATTPTTTLSKGQFYFIRNFYNPSGNIYNLYIKSTKPILCISVLAGTDGTDRTQNLQRAVSILSQHLAVIFRVV